MSTNIHYYGNGKSLDELRAISRESDMYKRDVLAPMSHVTYSPETCAIVVKEPANIFGDVYTAAEIENNALGQICDRLVAPPVRYMRECPPNLRAENLNYWQAKHAENTRKSDWLATCASLPMG